MSMRFALHLYPPSRRVEDKVHELYPTSNYEGLDLPHETPGNTALDQAFNNRPNGWSEAWFRPGSLAEPIA